MIEIENLTRELDVIISESLKAMNNSYVKNHASSFGLFFELLKLLISDNIRIDQSLVSSAEQLAPISSESTQCSYINNPKSSISSSMKHFNSLTIITSSSLKVHLKSSSSEQSLLDTPNQPTIPKNSAYNDDSVEFIDENNIKKMIKTFIHITLYHLGKDFREIL